MHRFWHVQVGDRLLENAAWTYDLKEKRPDLSGYVAFKWQAMDHWFEEEEVFLHPRHPYHRVDAVNSSRRVEVYVDRVKKLLRPYPKRPGRVYAARTLKTCQV